MNDGSPADHASLVAAHHARLQALLDSDLDALSKVVDEELLFISAFGDTKTWPEVVTSIKSGALNMKLMESDEISTRIYGEVGILTFKAHTISEDDGDTIETRTLSVTVYVKRDGNWKMVSQQHSPLQ